VHGLELGLSSHLRVFTLRCSTDCFKRRVVQADVCGFVQSEAKTLDPGMGPQSAVFLVRPKSNLALDTISTFDRGATTEQPTFASGSLCSLRKLLIGNLHQTLCDQLVQQSDQVLS